MYVEFKGLSTLIALHAFLLEDLPLEYPFVSSIDFISGTQLDSRCVCDIAHFLSALFAGV